MTTGGGPDGPIAYWCGRCEEDGHNWAGCPHNPDQEQPPTPSSAATPPALPSPPSREIWEWLVHPEADLFHYVPVTINLNQYASSAKVRAPSGRRPSLLHQNCVSLSQELDVPQLQASLQAVAKSVRQEERASGSRSSTDSPSVSSCGDQESLHHQMYEMERSLEAFTPDMESSTQDCKAVISGLLCGKPVQWEVTFDVSLVLKARLREETLQEDLWSETFHHLAARSVIRDFEQMADKENETEHGSGRRYQLNAIHTSKACNIISKHTAFLPIDLDSNEYLPTCIEYSNTGAEGLKQGSSRGSRSGSRKYRGYSIGLGRSQSGCGSDGPDDGFSTLNMEDNNLSPCSTPSSSGWERCSFAEAPQRSPSVSSVHSQRSIESLFSTRLSLSRNRLLSGAAKRFMCSSSSKTSESSGESDNENNHDYLPLVSLQLACGAFVLDSAFYEATHIPMEKLKWTSPFARHRLSATHTSHSSSSSSFKKTQENQAESADSAKGLSPLEIEINHSGGAGGRPRHFSGSQAESQSRIQKMENELSPPTVTVRRFSSPEHTQADSGRGSETDSCDGPLVHHSQYLPKNLEPEGMVWATAVALAWLEHSSAGYFIEWELVAAKHQEEVLEGKQNSLQLQHVYVQGCPVARPDSLDSSAFPDRPQPKLEVSVVNTFCFNNTPSSTPLCRLEVVLHQYRAAEHM
ncbi:von Willebrand factor A domain-containing protein 5B1-like [Polyodon spathula]|uniref:von Willebrand factor A domain-containing protein 5B1-like n=1 Tax=Polyodon spathula TaxID=7913 RepID=UPI001B7E0CFF|nr:von Willebrand factor A domain-containing protein 5B1-like [Polyodon spathula]